MALLYQLSYIGEVRPPNTSLLVLGPNEPMHESLCSYIGEAC